MMEVLYADNHHGLQLLKNDDKYTVTSQGKINESFWMDWSGIIRWALLPSAVVEWTEMDRFILDYFGEKLVTLVTLDNLCS